MISICPEDVTSCGSPPAMNLPRAVVLTQHSTLRLYSSCELILCALGWTPCEHKAYGIPGSVLAMGDAQKILKVVIVCD